VGMEAFAWAPTTTAIASGAGLSLHPEKEARIRMAMKRSESGFFMVNPP